MEKKRRNRDLLIFAVIAVILLVATILTGSAEVSPEPIEEAMRDAVLHESKVDLFGMQVNPAVISAFTVTGIMILFALIVRIFVIPKFKYVPGKFQLLLEQGVGLFDGLAKGNSPHRYKFLGAFVFTGGAYIFVSTIFELLGLQVVVTAGHSISLPAPLADINGAIAMGILSYGVIFIGGLVANGFRGIGKALIDFPLPISISAHLFGALISGAFVTELVYSAIGMSYVIPAVVGVIFTLLHAVILAYMLMMLVSISYGESTEPPEEE